MSESHTGVGPQWLWSKLTAWMRDGRITRSGLLDYSEKDGGVQDWSLAFRGFDDQVLRFDDSTSTVTIRSLNEINHTDSRDELTVRFRTVVIVGPLAESTWTQATDAIDAIQELVSFYLGPTSSGVICTVSSGRLLRLTKITGPVSTSRRLRKSQNPGDEPSLQGRMTTSRRRPKNSSL